jgi:uracil-DNA glycosylase
VHPAKSTLPPMRRPALKQFFEFLTQPSGPHAFNPWVQHDPTTDADSNAPAQRLARLRVHLECNPRWILIGEAPGYQGCKVSGIPFTSERLMLEGAIPRADLIESRLSTRTRPWSEPSATIVWGTLRELGIADRTILWNAYPWHPHRPGNLHSNRTPTPAERESGRPVLRALLKAFPNAHLFALGRQAEHTLAALGISATPLRHPAMGGATKFRAGLRHALPKR